MIAIYERVKGFCINWFNRYFKEAKPALIETTCKIEQVEQPTQKQKRRQSRRKTLAGLLGDIDNTFKNLNMPTHWQWTSSDPDIIRAVKRLGPHIPWHHHVLTALSMPIPETVDTSIMPAIFFISEGEQQTPTNELDTAAFFYGVKMAKCPWYVAKEDGVLYECGAAWRSLSGKLTWGNFYVRVDKVTGAVKAVDMLTLQRKHVKDYSYTSKTWDLGFAASAMICTPEERESVIRQWFIRSYTYAVSLPGNWKVVVTKGKHRVTWSIPPSETKTYFKDREANENGIKKRIIHHVSEHARVTKKGIVGVREHIRGQRKFSWKGYSIEVVAPKFHVVTNDFHAGAIPIDDVANDDVLKISEGVALLDKYESEGIRKPLPELRGVYH
jgi:hypothetical protein